MALIFSASFDLDNVLTNDWDGVGVGGVSAGSARNGPFGLNSNANQIYAKIIPVARQTTIVGVAAKSLGAISNGMGLFQWNNGAFGGANCCLHVYLTNTNSIVAYRGSGIGNLLGVSTLLVPNAQVFHYYQVKATIGTGTSGSVEVLVDGVTYLSLTGINTDAVGGQVASVLILGNNVVGSFGTNVAYDDLYFCDTTGNQNNNYLGDVTVVGQVPVANGTQNSFAQGGTVHAQNWQQVSEYPPDDDVTYVFDSNVGDEEGYTYGALSQTGANVYAVAFKPRMRKDQSGTRSVQLAHLSQGVEAYNGTDIPLSQNYATQYYQQPLDPATGQLWTIAGVNGCEQRIRITA